MESGAQTQSVSKHFGSLVLSSNGHNNQFWTKTNASAKSSIRAPMRVAGAPARGPSSAHSRLINKEADWYRNFQDSNQHS